MTILLLKGYNNYFNRIVKYEADITAYKTASTSYLEYANVNFDPQDGIMTSLVVGGDTQKKTETVNSQQVEKILDFESGGSPDYLIVHENNKIASRWFVVECVRVRAGQYKLALKRDVLVDFNEQIMNSPCYVEKGWIGDINNPLLLNSEGFVGNQQKQGEQVLRDSTNCAWLVGYLKKDMSTAHTVTYTFPDTPADPIEIDEKPWSDCVTYEDFDGTRTSPTKIATVYSDNASTIKFRTWCQCANANGGIDTVNVRLSMGLDGSLKENNISNNWDWQGLGSTALDLEFTGAPWYVGKAIGYNEAIKLGNEIFDHTFHWGYVTDKFDILVSAAKYSVIQGNNLVNAAEDVTKYDNQLVIKNNKVYRLHVGQGTEKTYDIYYTGEDNVCNDYLSMLYYQFKDYCFLYRNQDNPTKKKVKITLVYREYNITAKEELVAKTVTYTLPVSQSRNNCGDALYDMFCMPISPNYLGLPVADTDVAILTQGADVSTGEGIIFLDSASTAAEIAIASKLATTLGAGTDAGEIYDLQLLPYCPVLGDAFFTPYWQNQYYNTVYGKNVIDLSNLTSADCTVMYMHDEVDNTPVDIPIGVVFYPNKANFALKDIAYPPVRTSDYKYVGVNQTVHYEWLTIEKPTLLSQGRKDGLTRWTIHEGFPYSITEGPWEIGPNDNNPNVDVELSDGLTNEDCTYISLYSSPSLGGGYRPYLSITSEDLPLQEANDYSTKITGNFTVKVLAHWIKPDNEVDKKIKNECDFYRLTSPNYNSFYEFKATKLANGNIFDLNAICTYKPFTPYIKINPELDGSLYSIKDYDDNIGLMLGGDYSLPMLSDAMINYELQNRNYQAIFNRDLQSLDVNQRIAREQLDYQGIVGTIMGGFSGSASGLSAGMKTGNPYVAAGMAIAGGVAGNVLPAVGWAKDKEWLNEQQYDARDYKIDQFNYQIGNIRALPQSMTKSTPLSYNNKVWPILEKFSCTEEEKEILRNKIKYNGMTVMAIGKIRDYSTADSYIKGQMIRLENLGDDSHIANAIYEEINKGFYNGTIEEEPQNEGE